MGRRPGGELARRPLHFIWIADCSSSMSGQKIQALNQAVREALPHMQQVAQDNPHAEVLLRVVAFSSGARWEVAAPTPVENFQWQDLSASGYTATGHALELVAEQLSTEVMSTRALPPVLVLVSDGMPTDDFSAGLQTLMAEPWGKKAVRLAIAIGQDADRDVLHRFIGHPELEPLEANNPEDLVQHIRWASTAVLQSVSSPVSRLAGASSSANVVLPQAPSQVGVNDVW